MIAGCDTAGNWDRTGHADLSPNFHSPIGRVLVILSCSQLQRSDPQPRRPVFSSEISQAQPWYEKRNGCVFAWRIAANAAHDGGHMPQFTLNSGKTLCPHPWEAARPRLRFRGLLGWAEPILTQEDEPWRIIRKFL